jgi:hypothetical protein
MRSIETGKQELLHQCSEKYWWRCSRALTVRQTRQKGSRELRSLDPSSFWH